jgi:hypothetical protein
MDSQRSMIARVIMESPQRRVSDSQRSRSQGLPLLDHGTEIRGTRGTRAEEPGHAVDAIGKVMGEQVRRRDF